MNELKAFSITISTQSKQVYTLKKCYIMRHAHMKQHIWNTKVVLKLAYLGNMLKEIISMYEDQLKVPYIPDIRKGDVVTQKHYLMMNVWNTNQNYVHTKKGK